MGKTRSFHDEFLLCNKLVLANRSPYMKAMLTSGMTEVTNQEFRMENIRLDIMNIILDYMYCCDVSFHKYQLMDITVAADYLQMRELEEFCVAEIQYIVIPANVISFFFFFFLITNQPPLQGLLVRGACVLLWE